MTKTDLLPRSPLRIALRVLLLATVLGTLADAGYGSEIQNRSSFRFDLEGGPVWQSRNDVQIPNNEDGTRFSLVDATGKGPWSTGRLYAIWDVSDRSRLRLLVAPLAISEKGLLPAPVAFAGTDFEANTPTQAQYKFNSYRVTYSNRVYRSPRWLWRIGFTAKIRDAKIQLDQGGLSAKKTDVGFVPLLHVRGTYSLARDWRMILDIDALAGGPGRAEDAALMVQHDLGKTWQVSLGYRTVEGGADVDEVYTFAWLHYAVASLSIRP